MVIAHGFCLRPWNAPSFVQEAHAGTFFSAYLLATFWLLILVAAIEAVAFVIRLIAGLFGGRKQADERDAAPVSARANASPYS
jgi:hypothetical protein